MHAPFVLLPTYTAPWQQSSLLLGAAVRAVLPLGEGTVLSANIRAEGDVMICATQLDAAKGWTARVRPLRCRLWPAGFVHRRHRLTRQCCRSRNAVRPALQPKTRTDAAHVLSTGDVWTQSFELTPLHAADEVVPGAVVVRWETSAAAALGLPPLLSRLPLPPVRPVAGSPRIASRGASPVPPGPP